MVSLHWNVCKNFKTSIFSSPQCRHGRQTWQIITSGHWQHLPFSVSFTVIHLNLYYFIIWGTLCYWITPIGFYLNLANKCFEITFAIYSLTYINFVRFNSDIILWAFLPSVFIPYTLKICCHIFCGTNQKRFKMVLMPKQWIVEIWNLLS